MKINLDPTFITRGVLVFVITISLYQLLINKDSEIMALKFALLQNEIKTEELTKRINMIDNQLDQFELGSLNERLTRQEIMNNIWKESIINHQDARILIGKVVTNDDFSELQKSTPILINETNLVESYPLHSDIESYSIDLYGVVKTDNQKFMQQVLQNDKQSCTFVIIGNEIRYILMGEL